MTCVKGSNFDDPEKDYYGWITEIVELEYLSVSSFVISRKVSKDSRVIILGAKREFKDI